MKELLSNVGSGGGAPAAGTAAAAGGAAPAAEAPAEEKKEEEKEESDEDMVCIYSVCLSYLSRLMYAYVVFNRALASSTDLQALDLTCIVFTLHFLLHCISPLHTNNNTFAMVGRAFAGVPLIDDIVIVA